MATNLAMSNAAVNAEADALSSLADDGYLRIYDGAQPSTADTPVSSQVLLAELRLGSPAFQAAANGIINANPITPDEDAKATGTASWCRFLAQDGTPLFDGSVGLSGSLININSVSIQQHAVVSISSYQHTIPKS
jgi:hypothetical protein